MKKIKNRSVRKLYKTDKHLEKEGKEFLYADGMLKIKLARAGGSNTAFNLTLAEVSKPYKRAIQADLVSEETANKLLMETFTKCVIMKWWSLMEDDEGNEVFVEGVDLEGFEELQPVTAENMIKYFEEMPDIFTDVSQDAQKMSNYLLHVREEDSKN